MLRDFVIALSLANLWFLQSWRRILDPSSDFFYYHWEEHPQWDGLVAVTLNILLLAALFWTAVYLARRTGKPLMLALAQWAFILAALVPLNAARVQYRALWLSELRSMSSTTVFVILCLLFFALVIFAVFRFGRRGISRAFKALLLLFSPFVLMTFGQGAWLASKYAGHFKSKPPAQAFNEADASRPRIVWLVFDELDYRAAFSERPSSIALPELDALRRQSIFAANAYPPSNTTLVSMPALINGRLISEANPVRPDELSIIFQGRQDATDWSSQPNIFSRARELRKNTALVGWYHSYCRVIGDDLTACADELNRDRGVVRMMALQFKILVISIPFGQRVWTIFDLNKLYRRRGFIDEPKAQNILNYRNTLAESLRVVTDANLALVMLHLPVPHAPNIYDRTRKEISNKTGLSYLDNLVLVDATLGELRRAMETAGIWNDTNILITSDHWWRDNSKLDPNWTAEDTALFQGRAEHRVPFILRLAGQSEEITYQLPFNTILSHDLLLAILKGEVRAPQDAVRWLDAHRTIGESPYYYFK